MKKIGLILACFLSLVVCITPGLASAHIIKRQGPITVLLHINPNDKPAAQAPSQLLFIVANDNRVFSFSDYDTEVSVSENGTLLVDKQVIPAPNSFNSITVDYTFPHRGIFDIAIKATPKSGTKAEAFSVDYPFRIDEVAAGGKQQHPALIIFAVLGCVVLIFVFLRYLLGIRLKQVRHALKKLFRPKNNRK